MRIIKQVIKSTSISREILIELLNNSNAPKEQIPENAEIQVKKANLQGNTWVQFDWVEYFGPEME